MNRLLSLFYRPMNRFSSALPQRHRGCAQTGQSPVGGHQETDKYDQVPV
jgi:hypothetical protein